MNGLVSQLPSSSSSTGTSETFWVDEDGTLHETYSVLVLVGADLLGQFLVDPGSRPDLSYRRTGVAYFCQHCGEVWARLVFVDSKERQASFEVKTVACENHPDWWNVPGSLLAARLEGLLDLLPPAALQREVRVHFNYYGG